MKQIIFNTETREIVTASDPGFRLPAIPSGQEEALIENWIVATPGLHAYIDGEVVEDPTLAARYATARRAEQISALTAAMQLHMDTVAHAAGYDSIASAVTYADEPAVAKFQAEGQALRAWRSQVWATCYAGLDQVMNGTRAMPTAAEIIAELPTLTLPE